MTACCRALPGFPVTAEELAELIVLVRDGKLTRGRARDVLDVMVAKGRQIEERCCDGNL